MNFRRFTPTVLSLLLLAANTPTLSAAERIRKSSVSVSSFGKMPDGRHVPVYTLHNEKGMSATIMAYGATLIGVEVPDRDGKFENVTLYLDTLEDYLAGHPLMGSTVGRYANRIDGGKFTIDGKEHKLKTVGKNGVHIHGGKEGVQKLLWESEPLIEDDSAGVKLTHTSPDGHEGFPGTVEMTVIYRLAKDSNSLQIEWSAKTDKATHINLTNHAYWNLGGANSGNVLNQELQLFAERYLPADKRKIPTGELRPVHNTPMDFNVTHKIGARIAQVEGGGYDHCYEVSMIGNDIPFTGRRTAIAYDAKSGRKMTVYTTQPGVQFYTANYMSPKLKNSKGPYGKYHGFCLETQAFPNSPNQLEFPSTLIRPGETYQHFTVHRFDVDD